MKTSNKTLHRIVSRPLFLKLISPALLLLFSFKPSTGTWSPDFPVNRKEIKVQGDFKRIRIDGNISVMLTNEPEGTVSIEGKEKLLNRITHVLKDNTLIIDDHRNFGFSKLTIYLSAINLQAIQVNGDTYISSSEFIKSDNLHMTLNGNISVKVKTLGKLSFDTPEEIELLKQANKKAK